MRRVLMISPHFPPDSTAGTHRVRLLAPHLPAHGWEPTVLTVDPRDYEGALDPALADSVPADLRVVRARAWPTRVTRTIGIGDLGLRAFHGLRRQASRLMATERFDALFITIYPAYPALLGPVLKKRFGVPFVLDYQDPWVGQWGRTVGADADGHPDFKSRASRAAALRLEPIALRAADGVTAVSRATYEQALERTRDAAPTITAELPIGWDERDFAFLRERRPPASPLIPRGDGLVHLAYVGTLLPTGIETLRAFCAALALAAERDRAVATRLRVHFVGTSNLRSSSASARVLPVARECGVLDLVTERPERLDYFDALQTLVDASAVLLIGSNERHYTPSKVFPAMLSGRPLLAIYHVESTATALLRRFGQPPAVRVVSYDDQHSAIACVDDIAAHLCEMVQHPIERVISVTRGVLEPMSARSLAGRLAVVLERVSAARSVAATSVTVAGERS